MINGTLNRENRDKESETQEAWEKERSRRMNEHKHALVHRVSVYSRVKVGVFGTLVVYFHIGITIIMQTCIRRQVLHETLTTGSK